MRLPPLSCFVLVLVVLRPCVIRAQSSESTQKITVKAWTGPTLAADTAGGFAVESEAGGLLLAAAPASAPADSVRGVWFLSAGAGQWQASGVTVPAWTANAVWGRTMVCVGGVADGRPTDRVLAVGVRNGQVNVSELAPLPRAVAGAAAAVIDNVLYVCGGVSSIKPPRMENSLWTLALGTSGAAWRQAAELPGAGRAFCAAAVQYGQFCLFGGVGVPASGVNDRETASPTAETWVYRPTPLELTNATGWRRMADLPSPLMRSQAVPMGKAHVLLVGGRSDAAGVCSRPPRVLQRRTVRCSST